MGWQKINRDKGDFSLFFFKMYEVKTWEKDKKQVRITRPQEIQGLEQSNGPTLTHLVLGHVGQGQMGYIYKWLIGPKSPQSLVGYGQPKGQKDQTFFFNSHSSNIYFNFILLYFCIKRVCKKCIKEVAQNQLKVTVVKVG